MKTNLFILIITGHLVYAQQAHVPGALLSTSEDFDNSTYAVPPILARGAAPDTLNLYGFPPVPDQDGIGACVSWACVYAVASYLDHRERGRSYFTAAGELDPATVFSPLFVFNQVAEGNGTDCSQLSSRVPRTLRFIQQNGMCRMRSFDPKPYLSPNCRIQPDLTCRQEAFGQRIRNFSYFIGPGRTDCCGSKLRKIKTWLLSGSPVIIVAETDSSFNGPGGRTIEVNGRSLVLWDNFYRWKGYHCMVVVGYDDRLQALKIYNSYGTAWGNRGYGYIAYSMIDPHVLEAYVINVDEDYLISAKNVRASGPATKVSIEAVGVSNAVEGQPALKIVTVEAHKEKQTAVLQVLEVSNGDSRQVDIFTIKKDEVRTFEYGGTEYSILLEGLKDRLLKDPAPVYSVRRSESTR